MPSLAVTRLFTNHNCCDVVGKGSCDSQTSLGYVPRLKEKLGPGNEASAHLVPVDNSH